MKKLLGLVMIVKDAEDVIADTLGAIKPYIDRWDILDTGSTDRTPEIIEESMEGVEGTLYREPFVDFSTSRNRVLELAGDRCEYVIMLDDSYVLHGAEYLRNVLSNIEPRMSLSLYITNENKRFTKAVIFPPSGYRYRYRVHEVLYPSEHNILPKEIWIQEKPDMERTRVRLTSDLKNILLDLGEYPNNTRLVYYMAQTYQLLGDTENAIKWYTTRTWMTGGYEDELFLSHYILGQLYEIINDSPRAIQAYSKASEVHPFRVEPYVKLAGLLHKTNNMMSSLLLYVAYNLKDKQPKGMVVDMDIYERLGACD